jgi:hypothetical protein
MNRVDLGSTIASWLLALAAVVGSVCLGASNAWPRLALETLLTAACLIWAVSGHRPTRALAVPLAVAGLFLLQLLPLSDRMLIWLAPVSGGAWKIAAQGVDGFLGTVAVDPSATATAIRRLLLGLTTVGMVADLARSPNCRRVLVGSLAATGLLIWSLGLLFRTTPEERIILGFIDLKGPIDYWLTPLEPPQRTCGVGERSTLSIGDWRYTVVDSRAGDGFGPYIYSNHFAGALCLTVPAIMGYALVCFRNRGPAWVAQLCAAAVGIAGVATAALAVKSRAGAASLLMGVLVFFSLSLPLAWQRRVIGSLTGCAFAVLAGFMLMFFGPLRGWEKMLPSAAQPVVSAMLADPRVLETAVALRIARASPVLGTGLGSYGELNAALHPGRFVSHYAHNDYAQFLAEAGSLGAVILTAAAIFFGTGLRRFLAQPAAPDRGLSYASWAALGAIAVHSVFDWNLHLPANGFLASMAGGLALASAAPAAGAPARPSSRATIALTGLFAVSIVISFAYLVRDAVTESVQRQVRIAIAADRLRIKHNNAEVPERQLSDAIARGEKMAAWDPRNASLATLLAQAHVHRGAMAAPSENARQHVQAWTSRARLLTASGVRLPQMQPGAAPQADPRR